jgi:hypothetical protein
MQTGLRIVVSRRRCPYDCSNDRTNDAIGLDDL